MTPAKAYLLDIEGTTTPVDFVFKTLFPYARREMASFVSETWGSSELVADLLALSEVADAPPFASPAVSGEFLLKLMDEDRKSRGLKSIQGRIWQHGYATGELQGLIFPDVAPAIQRWKASGSAVFIYSSGSVLAQKLIFSTVPEGDLTPLIDGYFDTEIGPKREAESYRKIATQVSVAPSEILFLSDILQEIEAARQAGLQAAQILREGKKAETSPSFISFEAIS